MPQDMIDNECTKETRHLVRWVLYSGAPSAQGLLTLARLEAEQQAHEDGADFSTTLTTLLERRLRWIIKTVYEEALVTMFGKDVLTEPLDDIGSLVYPCCSPRHTMVLMHPLFERAIGKIDVTAAARLLAGQAHS